MFDKQSVIAVALEIVLIVGVGYSLWYKIFLPMAYYLVATLFVALIVAQMLTKGNRKSLVFQIALLVFLTNIVYYLATNYRIIPFWDANWDYAVAKTFIQEGNTFVIMEQEPPASILSSYSGWPLLHSLAFSFSQISGIDAFHISLGLPLLISITSFLFVYLIVEKVRRSLGLDTMVTNLALLIYATSAEALYWQIQFVRQNLGILMLFATIYAFHRSSINLTDSRKYKALAIFFAMTLVVTHHYTSFIMASFFFLFSAFQIISAHARVRRTRIRSKLFLTRPAPAMATLGLALLMFVFLFSWWDYFGTIIWPFVKAQITRLPRVFLGIQEFEYMPMPAYYPKTLTPTWATSLLMLRDILTYIPAFFGFFLLLFKKTKTRHEFFVIFSTLTFGLLFVIDNFALRVETFRLFMMASPFVALLSATFFTRFEKKLKGIGRFLFVTTVLIVFILASFIGLWGHRFAPVHLYDPSVNSVEVGERNIDFMRVNGFFSQKIRVNSFEAIWVDDDTSLVSLLQPNEYSKIRNVRLGYIQTHATMHPSINELLCAFKDFNLYSYSSGAYSPIKTLEEAQTLRYELYQYSDNNLNRIYDDGKYRFWVNQPP